MIIVPTNPAYMSGPNVAWTQAYNSVSEPLVDDFNRFTSGGYETYPGVDGESTFGGTLLFNGSTVRATNSTVAALVRSPGAGRTLTGQDVGTFSLKLSIDVLRTTATVFLGVGGSTFAGDEFPLIQIANGNISALRCKYLGSGDGGPVILQSQSVSSAAMTVGRYSVMRVGNSSYSQWYVYVGDTQVATFDHTAAGGLAKTGAFYYLGCSYGGADQATLDNLSLEYGII